eukprot:CAMPEP_0196656102 /NCGR_PEP_ID=MMETSP1086-20130531/13591_1 /TAXON_ID=77921 /ORGANISM="Cyanoptyche  gloeocystis , Strain SAG4.97" /LENGTH=54 /DNA_ID=CAMNT_0041988721 /DNA_START=35 /DNA_END=199 /DNA_ORIENTATION=+
MGRAALTERRGGRPSEPMAAIETKRVYETEEKDRVGVIEVRTTAVATPEAAVAT